MKIEAIRVFKKIVVSNHWTGLLEWNTEMDYWTDSFLVLHIFKGGVTVHLGDL